MVSFFELASIYSSYLVLLHGCLGCFERFVFGSRHDFLISDFLPFSQSCLYQINFLTLEDGGELISFTTWAWVWRGICIVDAFISVCVCDHLID